MNAVFALLVDGYRELNAKRMFWIALGFSGLIVVLFGGLALTPKGITLFGWHSPLEFGFSLSNPAAFYKVIYVTLGIQLWISWAAMILAIVSTAGIFPDFLASGSVDLYLARPIGRLRLYLVKYTCGLLFVALQVGVFSLASFVVIGLRGGVWEPGLLLAVPLAVLLFSYLFGVCALVGVLTRSTVAALLATFIFWIVASGMETADRALLMARIGDDRRAAMLDMQMANLEQAMTSATPATRPVVDPPSRPATLFDQLTGGVVRLLGTAPPTDQVSLRQQLAKLQEQRARITHEFDRPERIVYLIDTPLPKTTETIALVSRKLVAAARLPEGLAVDSSPDPYGFRARRADRQYASAVTDRLLRDRPAWRIIGTSLFFEVCVVSAGAWIFCRRDY
jgi:hypothetical protein